MLCVRVTKKGHRMDKAGRSGAGRAPIGGR